MCAAAACLAIDTRAHLTLRPSRCAAQIKRSCDFAARGIDKRIQGLRIRRRELGSLLPLRLLHLRQDRAALGLSTDH